MKTALKISLTLNLGLLAGWLIIWCEATPRVKPVAIPISPTRQPATPLSIRTVSPLPDPQPAKSSSFHWSQFDSSDYHIYVKNLRAIGCPEATVRAIVTADVHSVYQIFANQLEQRISQCEIGSWTSQLASASSEETLKDELQKIPDEEAAKIADLLGLRPAPATVASLTPAATLTAPLVMQKIDLTALNLNARQQQVVAGLQQDFLNQIGSTNQDPNDPGYQARWKKAQAYTDNMLEALLGNNIYTRYQLAAHQLMLNSLVGPTH